MVPVCIITPVGGVERAKYFKYWTALCRSMKEKAPGMSCPWYITSDRFTKAEWAAVLEEYPNARQWKIDRKRYEDPLHRGYPAFWKFEAANPGLGAQKVISLEADLLCDNDWSMLAYRCGEGVIHAVREPVRSQYGAAILVINRVAGYDGLYEKLLRTKHDGGWGTDQNIWNQMRITPIHNPDAIIERMGTPGSRGACTRPKFWNLWGKTKGESGTIPYVWKRWKEIMGEEMPRITSSVCGKYGSIDNKMREAKEYLAKKKAKKK
jgi:hypothetical protein